MRSLALLLLLGACAGPATRAASASGTRCPARGGSLAVVDAASGEPVDCAPVVVERDGERLFAGESDARGLVPVDVAAGEVLTVKLRDRAAHVRVEAPFPGVSVVELGDPGDRVRVLGQDGQPLAGLRVELQRNGKTVFTGTTSSFGVLARAPSDLGGVVAAADGVPPAPVDAGTRTVVLVPKEGE